MQIAGIGIDMVELERIEHLWQKKQERFISRILSEAERQVFHRLPSERRRLEFLAGRFAAKEAFAKAAGTGIGKLRFTQIEILPKENGAPMLRAPNYNPNGVFVSISHSKDYAIAEVIITQQS